MARIGHGVRQSFPVTVYMLSPYALVLRLSTNVIHHDRCTVSWSLLSLKPLKVPRFNFNFDVESCSFCKRTLFHF